MTLSYVIYVVLMMGVVAALTLTVSLGWSLQTVATGIVLLGALGYLAMQAELARRQLGDLKRLRAAYEQLDQQTKLIIRTDLELHRTQEELDRQLASLMSLHQFGQHLQVSLRPEEVFSKLDATVISNFGFSTGMLGMCPTLEAIEWRSLIGVSQPVADILKAHLMETGLLKQALTDPRPRILLAATANPAQGRLLGMLGVTAVVIAGIIPHTGPPGCLLLGRTGSVTNPKGEEELVAILTNQLVIATENSAMYEKTWASQRELERKVQERTRELAEANTELVRLNKAKSDFVSAVSHELRTPLAAIKGYAALLGSGQFGALASPQSERISKIEKQADGLAQLINNLLDIARIESGRVTMERRRIPVEEFLATVKDLIHPQLEAKHLQYAVDVDGVRELVGDPQHLQRVFVNLLSNAVKYTPEGGSIHVGMTRDSGAIVSTVNDTGCGIPAEDLPKLFQEFYRANDPVNQQIRGTGLGLALVKRIVEAHHGRISVISQKGHGSTFTITLPLEDPAPPPSAAAAPGAAAPSTT